MNAMRVYRLADGAGRARLYLNGVRVDRSAWDTAHFWGSTECHASRMETRRDGSTVVREYHCIRART